MLKSLCIKNFRLLEDFQVPKLGRVNLIVGKNNSGKSSVLEAIRIYAGNADRNLLERISIEHGEPIDLPEDYPRNTSQTLPFESFFSGRKFPIDSSKISVGELNNDTEKLIIEHQTFILEEEITRDEEGEEITRWKRNFLDIDNPTTINEPMYHGLRFHKGNDSVFQTLGLSKRRSSLSSLVDEIGCSAIPTSFISIDELAAEWDNIVFTNMEDTFKSALKIIEPKFENIVFTAAQKNIREEKIDSPRRIGKIKLTQTNHPIPLNSMGDGIKRLLQLTLKIPSAQNGFLLIDEFENGLHYSVQEKVWTLVFELAQRLNIQVFATTHSWDCIESFAKVAADRKDVEGVLFRVGKSMRASDKGKVIATVFDEEQLYQVTQADVEVR